MKALFLAISILSVTISGYAQKEDKPLTKIIVNEIKGFKGDIGIYIKNLRNGKWVNINADTIFPTASIVKIPIAIGIMDKLQKGELTYHGEHIYHDSLLYEGVDILGSFKSGEKIELSKLLMLMLATSDNTASLWLQSLAGSGLRINAILDSIGFLHTRVNSRTPNRESARLTYGWGQTTPHEMATLLEKIYKGQIISKAASERLLRLLNRNYWDAEALSQIPPYATIFSKNGAVNASRSEVAIVRGKKSEYLFCIFTKNNKDESWSKTNEAWTLTRKISAMLWRYFEDDNWQPADGAEKF